MDTGVDACKHFCLCIKVTKSVMTAKEAVVIRLNLN